jgi:uncharacterized protein (DUF488 family)
MWSRPGSPNRKRFASGSVRDEAGNHPDRVEWALVATLFTIGYEQHDTPASLIRVLRKAGVRRLVDVRELPLSRKRGFSKTPLAAALAGARIEYRHIRALGNPKPYRELYKQGDVKAGARAYRKHLHNGSYSSLVTLSEQLDDAPTCLLCFEAEHDECHRSVIVDALVKRLPTLEVEHLL